MVILLLELGYRLMLSIPRANDCTIVWLRSV